MTKQSGKMNDWERDICFRFKDVRENLKWSQLEFSERLGITRNQLASIECGRTPVRYEVAWRLRESFGISLRWLEEGEGFADDFRNDNLPPPDSTGLRKRALLSAVIEKTDKTALDEDTAPKSQSELLAAVMSVLEGKEKVTGKEDIANRVFLESQLKILLSGWMERVPVGHAFELVDKLNAFAEKFIRSLPEEPAGKAGLRGERIMWERKRMEIAKKIFPEFAKPPIDDIPKRGNNEAVKARLPELIKRLNTATRERGKKAALARFLKVPLPKVSQWLSGAHSPGGETTLQLLQWVEREERQ